MRPAALSLDLDSFAGPFDLLCTVLLRRELVVADIPLAEVVVGYVHRLAEEERVDPDTASEFLLLVAALMEIKARELLVDEAELDIEDPGSLEAQDDMLERLVRYATFRRAATWLGARRGEVGQVWWRVASRPAARRPQVYDGPVLDPQLLQRAMDVLLAQPDVDVRHLVGRHASVHEMTHRLLQALQQKRTFTLDDAVGELSRLDQAVAFVAALELCKVGRIELRQEERFGPIVVERREIAASDEEVEQAVDADVAAQGMEFQTA